MVLNKKGQVSVYLFMIAVVIIIMALAFAYPVNQITTSAMNETSEVGGMNCTATTDNFVKASCWVADVGQAYFIGGLLALAGVAIAARVIWGA